MNILVGYDGSKVAADASIRSLPEANGVFTTATSIANPDYLYAKETKEKYEARYSKPFNPYAAGGYDFVKLFSNLMDDQEISRKSAKRLLDLGFIYPGVFGDIKSKPGDHDILIPLHPARIENGKLKYR